MKKLQCEVSNADVSELLEHGYSIAVAPPGTYPNDLKALLLIAEEGEQLPEVPEWIKCSDRLPEVKSEVLVWEKDGPSDPGTIWIATRLSDTAWELGDCEPPFIVEAARVTHWQPLPKAPQQHFNAH